MQNEENKCPDVKNISGHDKRKNKLSNKLLWTVIFIVIAGLSIWMVTLQNRSFSLREFGEFIVSSFNLWLGASIVSMILFIILEGASVTLICRAFGYKKNLGHGYIYSASNIYFSAITPSATGGQPASAFFMMRDGIPGPVVTVALLLNLIMYTFAILIMGIAAFIINPSVFFHFTLFSKSLIVLGFLVQLILALFFILLLKRKSLLHGICDVTLRFLGKLHILRNVQSKREKLRISIDTYNGYVSSLAGKRDTLVKVLVTNVLQRFMLVAVTLFAFLAGGGSISDAKDIWVTESMVRLGSHSVPVPGAMGVADYLLLDGFDNMMSESSAVHLELLSRSISFYFCVLLCGVSVLVRLITDGIRKRRKIRLYAAEENTDGKS